MSSESLDAAWAALAGPLGVAGAAEGQEVASQPGTPSLAGTVAMMGPESAPGALILLREPGPGVANLFVMPMGEQIYISVRFFLFGPDAEATVARIEPEWTSWVGEHFPAEGETGE